MKWYRLDGELWPFVGILVVSFLVALKLGLGIAWVVGLYLLTCTACGFLGRYVAHEKRRSLEEGFWFGFALGIFGVFIVLLLPAKTS